MHQKSKYWELKQSQLKSLVIDLRMSRLPTLLPISDKSWNLPISKGKYFEKINFIFNYYKKKLRLKNV